MKAGAFESCRKSLGKESVFSVPREIMITTTTIIIINWKPIGVSNKFVLGKDTEKGRCRVF